MLTLTAVRVCRRGVVLEHVCLHRAQGIGGGAGRGRGAKAGEGVGSTVAAAAAAVVGPDGQYRHPFPPLSACALTLSCPPASPLPPPQHVYPHLILPAHLPPLPPSPCVPPPYPASPPSPPSPSPCVPSPYPGSPPPPPSPLSACALTLSCQSSMTARGHEMMLTGWYVWSNTSARLRLRLLRTPVGSLITAMPRHGLMCRVQGIGYTVQGIGRRVQDIGFRVQGSGYRAQGSGYRVQGIGCRVQGIGCRVQGIGCRVQSIGFRVQGIGCRVRDVGCSGHLCVWGGGHTHLHTTAQPWTERCRVQDLVSGYMSG